MKETRRGQATGQSVRKTLPFIQFKWNENLKIKYFFLFFCWDLFSSYFFVKYFKTAYAIHCPCSCLLPYAQNVSSRKYDKIKKNFPKSFLNDLVLKSIFFSKNGHISLSVNATEVIFYHRKANYVLNVL